jgi:hypothetical protein
MREQFPTKFSPRENSHGPDNPPLQQQISHLERKIKHLTTRLFENNMFFPKNKFIQWKLVLDLLRRSVGQNDEGMKKLMPSPKYTKANNIYCMP